MIGAVVFPQNVKYVTYNKKYVGIGYTRISKWLVFVGAQV